MARQKYSGQYASISVLPNGTPTGTVLHRGTYESSFFPVSATEVGVSGFSDGSALSSAAISRISSIRTRYGSGIWTRSPSKTLTYPSSMDSSTIYGYDQRKIHSLPQAALVFRLPKALTALLTATSPASPCRKRCTSTRTASPRQTSRRKSLPMWVRAAWHWARKTSRLHCPSP